MLPHRHALAALPPRGRQPGPAALSERRPRDTDAADTAFRLKRVYWSGAGAFIGMLGGAFAGRSMGAALVGAAAGGAGVYAISGAVIEGAGRLAGAILWPSGRSTPSRHGFSDVDALILRRRHDEAAALLERYAMDAPHDPEAYIRLARLHRDQRADLEAAITWFGHARATGALPPGLRRLLDDELAACRARLARNPEPTDPRP